jgi:transcriptional regulator with XRE-family HTH domain
MSSFTDPLYAPRRGEVAIQVRVFPIVQITSFGVDTKRQDRGILERLSKVSVIQYRPHDVEKRFFRLQRNLLIMLSLDCFATTLGPIISLMRDPRDLASAIKQLRGGRSQKEVAEKAEIDPSTWSLYEAGERGPRTQERFEQIARGLGCTPARFEEVVWEHRNKRIAREEGRPQAVDAIQEPRDEPPSSGRSDPESAIRVRITNLHQKLNGALQDLEEVLLLAVDPKRQEP